MMDLFIKMLYIERCVKDFEKYTKCTLEVGICELLFYLDATKCKHHRNIL